MKKVTEKIESSILYPDKISEYNAEVLIMQEEIEKISKSQKDFETSTKEKMHIALTESNEYSLVSNRRGVGIVGGLEKISKINSRGGWNNRGVGKNLSDSHFLYVVTVRKIQCNDITDVAQKS